MQGACQRTNGAISVFSIAWKPAQIRILLQGGKLFQVGTSCVYKGAVPCTLQGSFSHRLPSLPVSPFLS